MMRTPRFAHHAVVDVRAPMAAEHRESTDICEWRELHRQATRKDSVFSVHSVAIGVVVQNLGFSAAFWYMRMESMISFLASSTPAQPSTRHHLPSSRSL